ncbi:MULTISPECIES: CBS domain-containing protein [Methanobrevibacter]|uniref:CBS domain-containing protein n=1 Tax=Methanobrevibacter TaxID=2172 RepID=UPI0025D1CA25|nr:MULTISPECIES: CBS domain-containing protein [Methanobrevibacter]MBS7257878.1 CBS domain-containing protein [Methanobrevibacter sp.]MCI7428737.1 CBS domain-containing protein [Methanobrevibacter sp.]MDD6775809.1 CBS domain-containing protein [Methanobacteriaceae archaeon]MDY3096568.1 CBS domain-containing protein [Methanobrevibacter sp.]
MLVKRTMSKNVVSVSVPGNRDKVLDLMRKEKKAVLPVVKGDTDILVGVITRSDLINNPDEEQLAMLMSRDLVTVKPGDDVVDAARKMVDNNVRRVPVVDDEGALVGIITSFDIVSNALTKTEINDAVENYMITTVPTTWDKAPLNVAFETMNQFGLKSVLALDDDAKLSGILTETDFISEIEIISERSEHSSTVGTEGDKWSWDSTSVLYIEKNHLKFTDKVVCDVAVGNVEVANSKTKVSDCARKMKTLNIEQIPVIGVEGNLVGLVRASDLIKALIPQE